VASASRELLAPRADIWAFLAEPNHLCDWWPGITGVVPDRRGFATGARWQVNEVERQFLLPTTGRLSTARAPAITQTLEITAVAPLELWSWRLFGRRRWLRNAPPLTVEVRLVATEIDRTEVTVEVSGPQQLAREAVSRLYDLVQTAAAL
jgi:hypothetical protein